MFGVWRIGQHECVLRRCAPCRRGAGTAHHSSATAALPWTTHGAPAAGGGTPVTPGTGPGSDFLPLLRQNLTKLVATNSLQAFYPPQRIEEVLARLVQVDFRCEACPTLNHHARVWNRRRVCSAS